MEITNLNTSANTGNTTEIKPTRSVNVAPKIAGSLINIKNSSTLPVSAKRSFVNAIKTSFLSLFDKITNVFNFSKKEAAAHTADGSATVQQINAFKEHNLQSALSVLATLPPNDKIGDMAATKIMKGLKEIKSNGNSTELASDKDILAIKSFVSGLTNELATCFKQEHPDKTDKQIKAEVHQLFKAAKIERLNNASWDTLTNRFTFDGHSFTSTSTPAAQMKLKLDGHNLFEVDYQGKGVCSGDQKNSIHAANLWTSEFSVADDDGHPQVLFRGIRHGVLSPYELAVGSFERQKGAENRVKEVITAALFLDSDKLTQALKGETVDLKLTSTSLLTSVNMSSFTEKRQFTDQLTAWNRLSQEKPLKIKIRDENGKLQEIKIKLDVAVFNFGVNAFALKLGLGLGASDKYNQSGLEKLLGKDKKQLGGWVGDYLAKEPAPANAERVKHLATQLQNILNKKAHHSDLGDPYKTTRTIALLSHEIGITPAWNCKSGKDRTGMLDTEIKREAAAMHIKSPFDVKDRLPNAYGKLDDLNRKLLHEVLLHSGNLEIQEKNTGAPGNVVLGTHWLKDPLGIVLSTRTDRIADEAIAKKVRGLSGSVSS